MSEAKHPNGGVLGLVVALVVLLIGGVLFVGAVSGWFDDPKVTLDAEYYCEVDCGEFMEIDATSYDGLIAEKKSFVVFVDQGGCTTADRLRGFVTEYAKETGIRVYRMMFEEVKKTSLYESVKYYPSVAVVAKGKVVSWLRADSDEDAGAYNDYEEFKEWLNGRLELR